MSATRISSTDLSARLLSVFPELKDDLALCEGVPHQQASILADRMQRAKGGGDWETYERAARLVDELWSAADDGLENVLGVSVLERLGFDGVRGPRAWSLLSPALQRAWRSLRGAG